MKIKDGFIIEEVGGSYLAVAVGDRAADFHALIRLNGTGAFLWKLIADRDMTEGEMLEAMLGEYEVDADTASRDIAAFVKRLRDGGLIDG